MVWLGCSVSGGSDSTPAQDPAPSFRRPINALTFKVPSRRYPPPPNDRPKEDFDPSPHTGHLGGGGSLRVGIPKGQNSKAKRPLKNSFRSSAGPVI